MRAKRIWFVLTVTLLLTFIAAPGFAQSSAKQAKAAQKAAQPDRNDRRGRIFDMLQRKKDMVERQKKAIAGTGQVVADPINPPPGFPEEFRALHTFTEGEYRSIHRDFFASDKQDHGVILA